MIGAPASSGDDRAWRIGAYALAAAIHLPLIVVVQQFGSAIAAARPAESVITLLDTPDIRRPSLVDQEDGRAETVTQDAAIRLAAPSSAQRLEAAATATAIAPIPTSRPEAIPNGAEIDIASIIGTDTRAATSEPPAILSSPLSTSVASSVATAVAPALPAPVVGRGAVAPAVPSAISTPIIDVPLAVAPVETPDAATTVPADTTPLPAVTSGAFSSTTPAPTIAASAPVAGSVSRTIATAAERPPRIAIAATGPVPFENSAGVATLSASSPSLSASVAASAPTIATSPARVVAPPGSTTAATGAPTIARPIVDPNPQRLGETSPAPVVGADEQAPRLAAIPPDAAGPRADRKALAAFVRSYEGGGCFAALTVASTGDDIAVSGFSRDETALAGFRDALGQRPGVSATAAGRTVSEAQCSVLAFARSQTAYPDFPVRLTLEPDRIRSGGTISGTIAGTGERPVTMLILDDEGRIQDASFLLSRRADGTWFFQTPLSLTGSAVPTVQLFVALAGDGPIAAMRPPVPVEARRYFAEIDRLLKAGNQALDVALAAFTVDDAAAARP